MMSLPVVDSTSPRYDGQAGGMHPTAMHFLLHFSRSQREIDIYYHLTKQITIFFSSYLRNQIFRDFFKILFNFIYSICLVTKEIQRVSILTHT